MTNLSKREFLDRAYIQIEQFNGSIMDHVDYEKLPKEIKILAVKTQDALYALYNNMGALK